MANNITQDCLPKLNTHRLVARLIAPDISLAGELILLAAASGGGKTGWCQELWQAARAMGLNPCGLLSPAVYIGGEKTGIDLVDIGSGERRSLAVKRPTDQAARSRQAAPLASGQRDGAQAARSRQAAPLASGQRDGAQAARSRQAAGPNLFLTLGWLFDAETLAWGESRLQAMLKSSNLLPIDLLIIDEIGPLEFERNQGWVSGLRLVDQRNYRLACITIRPALLLAARKRWPWGQVVQLNVNKKT